MKWTTHNHFDEIQKKSTVEEAMNAEEPAPEPQERTMAPLSLTWGLSLAFRCEDIYSSEQ
jgi:hypothetical protein